jgi:hypothetical protein
LPEAYRDQILYALASSWVPVAVSTAHFERLDRIPLSDTQITRMAEPMAAGLLHDRFASLGRVARSHGAEVGVWVGSKQSDRVFARMYNGGSIKVNQVGPKDAIIEVNGLPFASSRSFRLSHYAFMRSVFSFSTKPCICKALPQAKPERLAVSLSWV